MSALGQWYESLAQGENSPIVRIVLPAMLVVASSAIVLLLVIWNPNGVAVSTGEILEFSAELGGRLVFTILLVVIAYAISRLLKGLLLGTQNARTRVTSEHQRRVSLYISQVTIYVFAFFAGLAVWGIQLSDLLVGAGVLGIILGLAAKKRSRRSLRGSS